MKLPIRISPQPIIDAITEFRFDTILHPSAVFGVIYNSLKNDYPAVSELPITQLPEVLRDKDESLRYKPHYLITSVKGFKVQIGPKVVTVSSPIEYVGWIVFENEVLRIINIMSELKIVKSVKKIGIRYIDFFEADIFEKINLSIEHSALDLESQSKNFQAVFADDNCKHIIQISNSANYNSMNGSVIDIDTILQGDEVRLEVVKDLLNNLHKKNKKLFFNLLKKEFIDTLNPEYE